MSSDTMVIAALGRPFTLGMLYDGLTDRLLPGVTLWDERTLSENADESYQPSSTFEVTASDTTKTKSTMLNIEASLRASFLCGLVEVGGSAKYLNDKKTSRNQSRVTLKYSVTTDFKQLMINIDAKGMQNTHILDKQLATHVVTGILYGANAFFVFDSEKLDASQVQTIGGSMQAAIKKIPAVDIQASASVELTTNEKDATNMFSCKFHGDFVLESNPTTFEDAVSTYQQLPNLLGGRRENAVPMKVWMMPLTNFFSKGALLASEITVGVVRKAQNALDDIDVLQMRCNDLLGDKAAQYFPETEAKIKNFQQLCRDYYVILQQDIAKVLPEIRNGKQDTSVLNDIFEKRNKSPFSEESLNEWMDAAERENNIMQICLDMMEGAKAVKSRSELDKNIFASGVKQAVCFIWTSIKEEDSFLSTLADYLRDYKHGKTQKFNPPSYDQLWYFSDKDMVKIKEKATVFGEFAKSVKNNRDVLCLIGVLPNDKYRGATIHYYEGGFLSNDNYAVPDIPAPDSIKDKSVLRWYSQDITMDPNTAHGSIRLSNGNRKASAGSDRMTLNNPFRFDSFRAVLCHQALVGRAYWEVDCDKAVEICAAYKGVGRKGSSNASQLGRNIKSWAFGMGNGAFLANHCDSQLILPMTERLRRVGVFLDWHAGTLSYYSVKGDRLTHLYTFNQKFTEPLYPGFLFSKGASISIVD